MHADPSPPSTPWDAPSPPTSTVSRDCPRTPCWMRATRSFARWGPGKPRERPGAGPAPDPAPPADAEPGSSCTSLAPAGPAFGGGARSRGPRCRRSRGCPYAPRPHRAACTTRSGWAGCRAVERLAATAARGGASWSSATTTATGSALAILTTILLKLGADARPFIPHRLTAAAASEPALCRALGAQPGHRDRRLRDHRGRDRRRATSRGVVVVTDHLPPAAAGGRGPRGPEAARLPVPFKEACGAGIAWSCPKPSSSIRARVGIDAAARRHWLASRRSRRSRPSPTWCAHGRTACSSRGGSRASPTRSPGLAALLKRSGVPAGRAPSTRGWRSDVARGSTRQPGSTTRARSSSDDDRRGARRTLRRDRDRERRAPRRQGSSRSCSRASRRPTRRATPIVEASPASEAGCAVLGIAASRVADRAARPAARARRNAVGGSGAPLAGRRSAGASPRRRRYTKGVRRSRTALDRIPAGSWRRSART